MTYLTGVVLEAIQAGHRYGFDIMDATGIPDGTVFVALGLCGVALLASYLPALRASRLDPLSALRAE